MFKEFFKKHPLSVVAIVIFIIGLIILVVGLLVGGSEFFKWFGTSQAFWLYGALGLFIIVWVGFEISQRIGRL